MAHSKSEREAFITDDYNNDEEVVSPTQRNAALALAHATSPKPRVRSSSPPSSSSSPTGPASAATGGDDGEDFFSGASSGAQGGGGRGAGQGAVGPVLVLRGDGGQAQGAGARADDAGAQRGDDSHRGAAAPRRQRQPAAAHHSANGAGPDRPASCRLFPAALHAVPLQRYPVHLSFDRCV
ncbi:hypothetical protein Pelo_681 [Pelomyxa schiedti]|nr:hypothetical protein Pelo_681 [Pelomyxa schiedti]